MAGYTWGNQKDGDYADYYNAKFMGFAQVTVTNPDGGVEIHKYHSTLGWGVYDCGQVNCAADGGSGATNCYSACHNDPWWTLSGQSIVNALHGHEYEADYYDTNGTTLLKKALTSYITGPSGSLCLPSGAGGSPANGYGNWDGQLVSELDPSNPVAVCDIQTSQTTAYTYDGSGASGVPQLTTNYSYDSYGRLTFQTETSNDGGASAATTSVANSPAYINNDNVSATSSSVTGTYLIDFQAFADSEDGGGNRFSCTYTSYDSAAWTTGQSSALTLGEPTKVEKDTACGTPGQQNYQDHGPGLFTTYAYDAYGNQVASSDPDANAGVTGHTGCTVGSTSYTDCTAYDSTFAALLVSHSNALNQTAATGYQSPLSGTSAGGFGLWPMSASDANGQTTSYAYDPLGRRAGQTLPNESSGLSTTGLSYADWCSGSGAQSPCLEIDHTQRLNSTTTVTGRVFYDGWGHVVETRQAGPNNQDVIRYSEYDTSGRLAVQSVPYFVTAYTGLPGAAAYASPDTSQPQSSHTYDGLGRLTSATDQLSHKTTNTISVVCGAMTGDSGCYEQTLTVDPLNHQGGGLVDAFGRRDYLIRYTGNSSSTYQPYATSRYSYDPNDNLVEIAQTNNPGWPSAPAPVSDAGPVAPPGLGGGMYHVVYTYNGASGESAPSPPGWALLSQSTGAHGINFGGVSGIPAGVTSVNVYLTSGAINHGLVTTLTVTNGTTPYYLIQNGGNGVMPPRATLVQFDMAGRKTGMTDPDTGTSSYGYDQNGNAVQAADARGSSGTVYAAYDGLDRPLWRNSTNSSSGAYETFTYDSTANGNVGVGRLTSETFSGGPNNSLSGSYTYTYDARGQETNATMVIGGTSYPVSTAFDDAGNTLSQTYPTGEVVSTGYTGQAWLSSVSTQLGSTNTSLLSGATYAQNEGAGQFGGAAQQVTGATLGGGTYQYSATYDALLRPTDLKLTNGSGSTTFFDQSRTFDAANNVQTANTTLPQGTDNQAFCYDEQDRLTWAGSTGTPPCGVGLTSGTLTSAQYTQSFAYDSLGRLTSGPLGAYSYGNGAHLHAATQIGSSYTAAYDAAGNMTCRAPSGSSTCVGTQTGAQLTYDTEGSLSAWQNAPSSPTTTAGFLYDGQGNRVEQQVTQNGTTTTTIYVGNLEEVATTGSTTTKTTYYYAGSARIAEAVNGTFSYLASDGLGSATVALNASGGVTASVLYAPYGSARYSNGTMPTDYGFTGQHSDGATGLNYFNARYYDPVAGQFTSADTVLPQNGYDLWGLSRYSYVEGNPITRTDPSGHCWPWCTAAIGFFIGATINYGSQVVGNLQHHQSLGAALTHVNVGEIAKSGMIGAIAGVGGPETLAGGLAARMVVAGVTGGGAQVGDNLLHGRHWSQGVGESALISVATFGLAHGGSAGLRAMARTWGRAAIDDGAAAYRESAGIVRASVRRVQARDMDQLAGRFLSRAEQDQFYGNEKTTAMFRGTMIHRAVAADLRENYGTRFMYRPNRGVDFFDQRNRARIELTTEQDVPAHQVRYRFLQLPDQAYVTYDWSPHRGGPQ